MKVILHFDEYRVSVIKEVGDPHFSGGWSTAESNFLYHVKKELVKQGYDVIKKRMWKDGHMVSDTQQYIRTRRNSFEQNGNKNEFCIWNSAYAVFDAGESFNKNGNVVLDLVY